MIQAIVSTVLERHEVVDSHLTELEHIQDTEGDSALRSSMRRLLRDEPLEAPAAEGAPTSEDPGSADGSEGGPDG